LGWEAKIGVREGIAATVRWLREREGATLQTPVTAPPEGPAEG
jgi:hypothetical protein